MIRKAALVALVATILSPLLAAADGPPVPLKSASKKAIDRGCNWLIDNQRADGSFGSYQSDVGITGLVVDALSRSHRKYREDHGPFISLAVKYLMSHRKDNGSFFNAGQGLQNYKTSVTILALTGLDEGRKEPRYSEIVAAARDFVVGLQCSEDSKPVPYDKGENPASYGGIGYGSDRKPDLSNTQIALDALDVAGLSEDSDVFKRVQVFLERCQNAKGNDFLGGKGRSVTGDGGFIYYPGESKAGTVTNPDGTTSYRSYGSMTYAGLKSYIHAGLSKDDPRVQAAFSWIRANFTVDENPGMATPENKNRGQMGLYYYFLVMARTFDALGVSSFEGPDGKTIHWANELTKKLLALQSPEGFWQNRVDRWWEADRAVVTAYSVRALTIASKYLQE